MLQKVFYTSGLVSDQDEALDFYTNVIGLEKRVENPTPDGPRFLTVGVARGVVATAAYAHTKHWATVIPTEAWAGGIAASLIIGAVAGLIPALRAARLSPTQALWSV